MKYTILLTGDVNLRGFTEVDEPLGQVAEVFSEADVVFGNLEGCLYDSEDEVAYKPGWRHSGTAAAGSLKNAGFDAMGCANNVTFGDEAITSTLAILDEMGIAHTGAGVDRASARAPVVVRREGLSVGFLQYSSVFWPIEHEAGDNSIGIATVKAHTAYEPHPRWVEMPGGPATVITWPEQESLSAFEDDIHALRPDVDLVIVSCHWGISGSDETAQYQAALGHAAVDAGADLVMGHGPHMIQAVEVYKDKPIFYSLGNFLFGSALVRYDWVGLMVSVDVEDGNVAQVRCSPVRPNASGQVRVRSAQEENQAIERFLALSGEYGTHPDLSSQDVMVWSPRKSAALGR